MKRCYKRSGRCFAAVLFCLLFAAATIENIEALEISRGNVRLSLHEESGRFSLYGMNKEGRFEPFFSDGDPRTSFIELYVNKRLYRLGDSSAFRFRVEAGEDSPAIVFESGDLELREEFSFIQSAGSSVDNGVQITIRVRNRRQDAVTAGLRLLLDTSLGEGHGKIPFFLNEQEIPAETLIGGSIDHPWVSRGASLSLMGSIGRGPSQAAGINRSGGNPDYLHFANWKRLSEASWKAASGTGRNFDYPPYSFNDAAVCYYYDPVPLPQYGEIYCAILLAAEDPAGFGRSRPEADAAGHEAAAVSGNPEPSALSAREEALIEGNSRETDLALLRSLISRMNYYLEGKIDITAEELSVMEESIARLKTRYNIP